MHLSSFFNLKIDKLHLPELVFSLQGRPAHFHLHLFILNIVTLQILRITIRGMILDDLGKYKSDIKMQVIYRNLDTLYLPIFP